MADQPIPRPLAPVIHPFPLDALQQEPRQANDFLALVVLALMLANLVLLMALSS
jgi:hypothetical protein